jgi:predicted GNAT family acetyltransferase
MTDTKVVDNPQADRCDLLVDGEVAGHVEYQRSGSTITFTHTEIDSSFEGRGLGSVLARGVLDAARAEGMSVLPVCPFILRFIKRHGEYLDLVPADKREQFDLEPVPDEAGRA